jgi:hypothetical protein
VIVGRLRLGGSRESYPPLPDFFDGDARVSPSPQIGFNAGVCAAPELLGSQSGDDA